MTDAYPNLQPVLTRPINWELVRQQYNQMMKYATALRPSWLPILHTYELESGLYISLSFKICLAMKLWLGVFRNEMTLL